MTEDGTQWQRLAREGGEDGARRWAGWRVLVVAIGTKLIAHSWDGENLTPNAFFDTPLHTVTINTVKNFILLGDLQKGAHFFRWKDTPNEKLLVQLAKISRRWTSSPPSFWSTEARSASSPRT